MSIGIKVYGERNSGTIYLEKLLDNNLKARVLKFKPSVISILFLKMIQYDFVQDVVYFFQKAKILGWKHGCPLIKEINKFDNQPLIIITITKNPYSFLLSLYKNPYHYKGKKAAEFSQFLKDKWTLRGRDAYNKKHLKSPIELWNIKNKSYIELSEKTAKVVINLTYETLINDPEGTIRFIANKANVGLKNGDFFKNITTSTKNSGTTFEDYKDYYLNEKWRTKLDSEAINLINTSLDFSVLSYFDYHLQYENQNE